MERKKIARWSDETESAIFFFEVGRFQEEGKAAIVEVLTAARRLGKVVFWNGEDGDPLAIHCPGEVRC